MNNSRPKILVKLVALTNAFLRESPGEKRSERAAVLALVESALLAAGVWEGVEPLYWRAQGEEEWLAEGADPAKVDAFLWGPDGDATRVEIR